MQAYSVVWCKPSPKEDYDAVEAIIVCSSIHNVINEFRKRYPEHDVELIESIAKLNGAVIVE